VVTVLYRHGSRLASDCTVKSRLERKQVKESQFADDLHCMLHPELYYESVGRSFVVEASHFGLTVSLSKTKGLAGIDGTCRIAMASRVFGSLCEAIFVN